MWPAYMLTGWFKIREERRRAVEDHVQAINKILREAEAAGTTEQDENASEGEWQGLSDTEVPEAPIDIEEEYIDEDKYTTVKVEAVTVDRDGLHKPQLDDTSEDEASGPEKEAGTNTAEQDGTGPVKRPKEKAKKKKKKFRYETKFERELEAKKQKAKRRKR